MKQKVILAVLVVLYGMSSYAQTEGNAVARQTGTVQAGDTVFLKRKTMFHFQMEEPLTIVPDTVATYFGLIKSVSDSTANLQIFHRPNGENVGAVFVGTRKVIADSLAAGQLVLIGRQADFYPTQPPRIKSGRVYNTQHLLVSATMQDTTGHVFRKGFLQDGKYVEQQFYDNDTLRLTRHSFPSHILMAGYATDREDDKRFDRNGRPATEEQVPGDLWAFDDGVRVTFNRLPAFGSGVDDLTAYLSKKLKYPAVCQEKRIEGRSLVLFRIDTTGQVTDATIEKSSGNEHLDKEALRVVSGMPNWQPAISDGKKVGGKFSVPVHFRLPKEDVDDKPIAEKKQDKPKSLADLHEGDTLWIEKISSVDIPYTTKNQRDPYPTFYYELIDKNSASHYAVFRKQEKIYTLAIHDITSQQMVKMERYTLSGNGTAVLNGYSDFYNHDHIVYRDLYQNGVRKKGEWFNGHGKVYKQAVFEGRILKTIQSIDPSTQKVWKQKEFVPNPESYTSPDLVKISYFSSDGKQINSSALTYQPPVSQQSLSEEDISRWLSRNFTIASYFHFVGFFKWSGNMLVDETGNLVAFADGLHKAESMLKRRQSVAGQMVPPDMLSKVSEYVRFQPARRGDYADIGEVPLSFCYSPLYYASTGDTLYCSGYKEISNTEGERTKVYLRNTRKQTAPYYAVVKRDGDKLDLDFYRVADAALLKRSHYVCIAPDSILPDGIVEMRLGNRMMPIQKFDKGKEYNNWFLNQLSVGESIPVRRWTNQMYEYRISFLNQLLVGESIPVEIWTDQMIEFHKNEIIGIIPDAYNPDPEGNQYAAIIRSQSGDTIEVEYIDVATNQQVESGWYVRSRDNQYDLKEQLVYINFKEKPVTDYISGSLSIRTEFITDSTEYRSIYNERRVIHAQYYVRLTEVGKSFRNSPLPKKVKRSDMIYAEKYDSVGNLLCKEWFDSDENHTMVEVFYPTRETKIRVNLTDNTTEHFNVSGQPIKGNLVIPKKMKEMLRNYILSYKKPKIEGEFLQYIWKDLYVYFYVTATGEVELLDFYASETAYKHHRYWSTMEKDLQNINYSFSNHLKEVKNAGLRINPCTINGNPVDNVVIVHIKEIVK